MLLLFSHIYIDSKFLWKTHFSPLCFCCLVVFSTGCKLWWICWLYVTTRWRHLESINPPPCVFLQATLQRSSEHPHQSHAWLPVTRWYIQQEWIHHQEHVFCLNPPLPLTRCRFKQLPKCIFTITWVVNYCSVFSFWFLKEDLLIILSPV